MSELIHFLLNFAIAHAQWLLGLSEFVILVLHLYARKLYNHFQLKSWVRCGLDCIYSWSLPSFLLSCVSSGQHPKTFYLNDIFLSCFCCAFVRVCLLMPCGPLLGKGWPLVSRVWCLIVKVSLSNWNPGSGVGLIVSIPDLCPLSNFHVFPRDNIHKPFISMTFFCLVFVMLSCASVYWCLVAP